MSVIPEHSTGDRSSADKRQRRDVMIGTGIGLVVFGIVLLVLGGTAMGIALIVFAPILLLLTSRDWSSRQPARGSA